MARPVAIPLILFLCVTLPHLGDGDWRRSDSGWYSAIGLQAWRDASLWTLQGEPGQPYFNKPPVAFWIHGLSLHVVGTGAWQARLPTVLAGAGCVVLTSLIAWRLAGRRAGLASGTVLALTYEFFRRTREISLDMWQTLFLLGFLALLVEGATRWGAARPPARRPDAWLWALASGVSLAAALMTKPLVGLVAIPIVLAWLAWERRLRLASWVLAGSALGVGLASIWHVAMVVEHGEAFKGQYFGAEIGGRAAGTLDTESPGVGFYLKTIVGSYWPWLIAVAGAVVLWARRGALTSAGSLEKLGVVWALGWLVLLEVFPDRRDRYALVLWPGLAWLAGLGLAVAAPAVAPGLRRAGRVAERWMTLAAVVGAVAFALVPVSVQRPINPQWPALFAWLDEQGLEEGDLWQGAFQGSRGARLYLRYGWWPVTTRNRWDEFVAEPPEGALLVYHRRDGLAPGINEEVVYQGGDLGVTRLGPGGWRPVEVDDPGEAPDE